MKLSKEELLEKINGLGIEDEIKISLMEDISDSIDSNEENGELEEVKAKYEELKEKYKARFLGGNEEEKAEEKEEKDEEELKEEEVIDVKEI